jgi:glycosyltransferase involved in cell wall biosynthesis
MSIPKRPLVLRVITRLAGGGPPMHATLLNRNLERHGFESLLVFGDCGPEEMNMEYLLAAGDRLERVPSLQARVNPWADMQALWGLWRLMRKYRPSVVHTHTAKAGLLGRVAALLAGVPYIVHTYHGHVLEGYFGPTQNRILRSIEKALGWISSALCTVSRQQADELSRRFGVADDEKFHVVPLGIELAPLLAVPAPNFECERITIGWLGRFVPIKNLKLLVDVVEASQSAGLPIDFILAGDGAERPWIEEEARQRRLTNLTLLPWQDRVEPVLSACHLLMLTSHREGTPLALIQGMAAGRPFLSTPAGGTIDLAAGVCQPGTAFWWYSNAILAAASTDAFMAALRALLSDRGRLASMSTAAREFAVQSFDEQRLVADLADLYGRLLKEQRVSGARIREVHP